MKALLAFCLGIFIGAAGPAGCDSSYTRVRAIKMASIQPPRNLSSDPHCQTLWSNIARAGIDMDAFRDDWNDGILDSATFLIEDGCVERARAGF